MKRFMLMLVAAFALCAFGGVAVAADKVSPDEAAFLKDGPKLYTMADALKVSEATGKPVVCWMGPHLFADARARKLSTELGETTIQAAMDSDGSEFDASAPLRVKFSDGGYKESAKTFFIRVDNFEKPGTAEKILKVSRGGQSEIK